MINIEEHSSNESAKYISTATVQAIVWAITHGKELTTNDIKEYLKNIDSDS